MDNYGFHKFSSLINANSRKYYVINAIFEISLILHVNMYSKVIFEKLVKMYKMYTILTSYFYNMLTIRPYLVHS